MALLVIATLSVAGQNSREGIRKVITRWGGCTNVAITESNGDLALFNRNDWVGVGIPNSLKNALNELKAADDLINDVCLTEKGSWLILHGENNGFKWYNIPKSLESELRDFNERGETVLSTSFNDAGDWIVVGEKFFSASSQELIDFLNKHQEDGTVLTTACVSDKMCVAVYTTEYGHSWFYNYYLTDGPISMKMWRRMFRTEKKANKKNITIYRIKVAGNAWFMADQNGWYQYEM